MATRYWVGGTGTWSTSSTANWSATSGGASGASAPTSADDVIFDSSSGSGTCTLNAGTAMACRSLNQTGWSGTMVWSSAATVLNVGDASGGALTLGSGVTYSVTTGTLNLASTSTNGGAGWPITSNGKVLTNLTLQLTGNGGRWQLQDNLSLGTSGNGTITHQWGHLDTNSKTVTTVQWSGAAYANTRRLTLGSSALNCYGGSAPFQYVSTGMTIDANTATLYLYGNGANVQFGGLDWNGLSVTQNSGTGPNIFGANGSVIKNFTRNGTASTGDFLNINCNMRITGTLTIAGNSTTNRLLVQSSTIGTQYTITCDNPPVLSNADFIDIASAGAGGTWSGTSIADGGGNSGITFTPAVTRYCLGGTWATTAAWSASSGGSSGASVPLIHDDVIMDSGTTSNISSNLPRLCRNLTMTSGMTRSLTISVSSSIAGSLTLSPNCTFLNSQITFIGRGTSTITMNGKSWNTNQALVVQAPGGTVQLQDAFTISNATTNGISVNNGTLDTNGQTVTIGRLVSSNSQTRGITLGTSVINITDTTNAATVVNVGGNGLTLSAASSTINVAATVSGTRNFTGGTNALTWGALVYNSGYGSGILAITTGGMSFTSWTIGAGRQITTVSGTTTTVGTIIPAGSSYPSQGFSYINGITGLGVNGTCSVPTSAALTTTGDFDIRIKAALDTWTPSSQSMIFSKWNTGAQRIWYLSVDSTGKLTLGISANGGTSSAAVSTVATGFAAGSVNWIRVTRESSTGAVKFYTSPDGTSWTQLGTTVTSTTGALFSSTSQVEIGSYDNGAQPAPGRYYRAIIINNILDNGTGIQLDVDFSTRPFGANSFTESSSNAYTVSFGSLMTWSDGRAGIQSSVSGSRATLSQASGTVAGDYLYLKDSLASGGATFYAGSHSTDVSNNSGWLFTDPPKSQGNFLIFA